MDEAIKLDQQQYPDCFYSTMSESMCSLERHEGNKAGSSSGAYICSVLKKVQRNCAGERPVTIYSHREEKNDPSIPSKLASSNWREYRKLGKQCQGS